MSFGLKSTLSRKVRTMKNFTDRYRPGFCLFGLIAFLVQELPYLPWMLWPPKIDPLVGNIAPYMWLEITEKVAGILTVAILMMIITKDDGKTRNRRFLILAAVCLSIYYISWMAYFSEFSPGWLMVFGLSAVVPIYYLFVALYLENKLALIPCTVFFVAHTTANAINYLL